MLDESQSTERQSARPLRPVERAVLEELVRRSQTPEVYLPLLDSIHVEEMSDGGMGSLYVVHQCKTAASRRFGSRISELKFQDADGTPVIVSLNVDRDGDLYEIDVWKVNYRPVVDLRRATAK